MFDPANQKDMSPQKYSNVKQKLEFLENLISKVKLIPNQDIITEDFTLRTTIDRSTDAIKETKKSFKTLVESIESNKLKYKLLDVPGYSVDDIKSQTIYGFTKAKMLLDHPKDLDTFCEKFLTTEEALLNGDVIHLFYDRSHMLGGLLQGKEFVIGSSNYSYREIFEKLLDKLDGDMDSKYPDTAYEQILTRIDKLTRETHKDMDSIKQSDLRLQEEMKKYLEKIQIETKKALEALPNGPINQTRFDRDIVNACKLLFGPNKDKVEYKDGKVIYKQDSIEINLTRAVKLGSLETASVILAQDAPEIFYDVLIGIQDPAPASTIRDTVKKLTLKECKDLNRYLQEDEGIISNCEHLLEEVTYEGNEEREKVIIELTKLIELHESQYKEAEGIYQKDSDPRELTDENVRNYQNINKFARSPELYLNKKKDCIKTLLALNIVLLKARNDKLADTDISHSIRHEMQCVFRHYKEVVDMKGITSSSAPGGYFKPEGYERHAPPYMCDTIVVGRLPGIGKDGHYNHELERTSTGTHVAIHDDNYGEIIVQANSPNNLVDKFNINPNYLQDLFKLDNNNLKEKITELIKLGLDPTFSHYSADSKSLLDLALEKSNDIVLRAIMNGPFDLGDILSKTKEEHHPTLLDKITRDAHTYSKIQILIKILTLQEECRTKKRYIRTPKTENKLIKTLNNHLKKLTDPELSGGSDTNRQSTHDILKINIKSHHLDLVNRSARRHFDRNRRSLFDLITDLNLATPKICPKVFFDCLGEDMLEYQLKQNWSEERTHMKVTMNNLRDDWFDHMMGSLGGAKISRIILHNVKTGEDGKENRGAHIHELNQSKLEILTKYMKPEQLIIAALQNRKLQHKKISILNKIICKLNVTNVKHIIAIKHAIYEIQMRPPLINSIETRQREYKRAADRNCMLLPWRTAGWFGGVREKKRTYLAEVAAALKKPGYGERKLAVNKIIAKYESPDKALEMATIKSSFFGRSKCKKIHSQLEALNLKAPPA